MQPLYTQDRRSKEKGVVPSPHHQYVPPLHHLNNENMSPNIVLNTVYHKNKKSPKNKTYSILYNNLVNDQERIATSPRETALDYKNMHTSRERKDE